MALPRTKQIERQGLHSEPLTHHYPRVFGGVCEFCGIVDNGLDSKDQYKLCEHYRGMALKCSYCDSTKDQEEVARRSTLHIVDSPEPGKLIVWCDSFECSSRHLARFKRSA